MKITIFALSILVVSLSLVLARVFIPLALSDGSVTYYEPNAPIRIAEGIIYGAIAWCSLCFTISYTFYNWQLKRSSR